MEGMEEKILQVLQDPQQMEQIMGLAKSLGFEPNQENTEHNGDSSAGIPIMDLLQQNSTAEPRRDALIHALLPYLKPERQRKLQQAVKLAKLSNLAGYALKNFAEQS